MIKTIVIPKENSVVYDMRRTRGYRSLKHGKKFYHKFRDEKSYKRWIKTGEIEFAWGENVWEVIQNGRV